MVPSLYGLEALWEEAEKLNVFFLEDRHREMLKARLEARGDVHGRQH